MSNLGRTITQIKNSNKKKSKLFVKQKFPIGIKTPLEKGFRDNESLFKMHFDVLEQIKDNLKNLILTQKGERLGFPDFGTDLLKIYSNTSLSEDDISTIVMNDISDTVSKYMPSLFLSNFYSKKISPEELGAANIAKDFSNELSNISIGDINTKKINKMSYNKESVYKIELEYLVASASEATQNLILYIKSAR